MSKFKDGDRVIVVAEQSTFAQGVRGERKGTQGTVVGDGAPDEHGDIQVKWDYMSDDSGLGYLWARPEDLELASGATAPVGPAYRLKLVSPEGAVIDNIKVNFADLVLAQDGHGAPLAHDILRNLNLGPARA